MCGCTGWDVEPSFDGPIGPSDALLCPPGQTLNRALGDACCPAGTLGTVDGCVPAGVRSCPDGFDHDGTGCVPMLADNCALGMMALPGETCREVAPCGMTTWGEIPIDAATEHVDAAFAGASDGSAAAPWTTIAAALASASDGDTIALAAGRYEEDVVPDLRVQIWGRCPAMVEIAGTISFFTNHDAALRDVAVTGPVVVSGSTGVIVDRVWLHDNPEQALTSRDDLGPTDVTVTRSLIEQNTGTGILAASGTVTVNASVVRDNDGRGASLQNGEGTISGSIFARNREVGIFSQDSLASVTATLVHSTRRIDTGERGSGIIVQGQDGTAMIRASVISDNSSSGISMVGANATIVDTTVRRTQTEDNGTFGRAVILQNGVGAVTGCSIEDNSVISILVSGADATIDRTLVSGTKPDALVGDDGNGIVVQNEPGTDRRSDVTIRSSVIRNNVTAGVLAVGSDLELEGSRVHDTATGFFAASGFGVAISSIGGRSADGVLRGNVIENNMLAAVLVDDSPAVIEATLVRDEPSLGAVLIDADVALRDNIIDRIGGDGITVLSETSVSLATVVRSLIMNSGRAGIALFGGDLALSQSGTTCSGFDVAAERAFVFDDLGENLCGCPAPDRDCALVSPGLQPLIVR